MGTASVKLHAETEKDDKQIKKDQNRIEANHKINCVVWRT